MYKNHFIKNKKDFRRKIKKSLDTNFYTKIFQDFKILLNKIINTSNIHSQLKNFFFAGRNYKTIQKMPNVVTNSFEKELYKKQLTKLYHFKNKHNITKKMYSVAKTK